MHCSQVIVDYVEYLFDFPHDLENRVKQRLSVMTALICPLSLHNYPPQQVQYLALA